jgi:hypothetical protein
MRFFQLSVPRPVSATSGSEVQMKTIAVTVVLCLLMFGGYQWYSSRQAEQFVKAKRSELSGYRLEYFENEKLLFVHSPDGSRDRVELTGLNRVSLERIYGRDNTTNEDSYFWRIRPAERRALTIMYFSVDPLTLISILKKAIPDLDIETSLKRIAEFERNEYNFCSIWMSPGEIELVPERGYSVCVPL